MNETVPYRSLDKARSKIIVASQSGFFLRQPSFLPPSPAPDDLPCDRNRCVDPSRVARPLLRKDHRNRDRDKPGYSERAAQHDERARLDLLELVQFERFPKAIRVREHERENRVNSSETDTEDFHQDRRLLWANRRHD